MYLQLGQAAEQHWGHTCQRNNIRVTSIRETLQLNFPATRGLDSLEIIQDCAIFGSKLCLVSSQQELFAFTSCRRASSRRRPRSSPGKGGDTSGGRGGGDRRSGSWAPCRGRAPRCARCCSGTLHSLAAAATRSRRTCSCAGAGVQVCRCAGVQVCRCAGVQVCGCAGVQECRGAGVQVCRCAGVQVCRVPPKLLGQGRPAPLAGPVEGQGGSFQRAGQLQVPGGGKLGFLKYFI